MPTALLLLYILLFRLAGRFGREQQRCSFEPMKVRTAKKESVYDYDNPEFQELVEMQAFTQDESERQEMIARMQQTLAEDVPVLPLFYPYFQHV